MTEICLRGQNASDYGPDTTAARSVDDRDHTAIKPIFGIEDWTRASKDTAAYIHPVLDALIANIFLL